MFEQQSIMAERGRSARSSAKRGASASSSRLAGPEDRLPLDQGLVQNDATFSVLTPEASVPASPDKPMNIVSTIRASFCSVSLSPR